MAVSEQLRRVREQTSLFSELFDFVDDYEESLREEGRRSVLGGLFSKEPEYGTDTLEYEGIKPFLANLVEPVARAIDAPRAAYEGLIPEEDMLAEAFNTAGMAMGGGSLGVVPEGAVAANALRGGSLNSIIDQSLDKINQEIIDPGGLSSVKMPIRPQDLRVVTQDNAPMVPNQNFSFDDLPSNAVLVPAFGDRTYGGKLLTEVGDVKLSRPVDMQGGHDFMRYEDTGLWASEVDAMAKKATRIDKIIEEGGDPYLVYVSMAGQSADFSHMMSDVMMELIEQSSISKKAAAEFDKFVRNTGGKFKESPSDKNWPGILSPDAKDYLINNMKGTNRRLIWQQMDKNKWTDQGFPFVGVARAAITDPGLQTVAPFSSGRAVGQATGGGLLDFDDVKYDNRPVRRHGSYAAQIEGIYKGGTEADIPAQMLFRNFFDARRAAGKATGSDQRSFLMGDIYQPVDQRLIDDVGGYLERVRNLGYGNN